MESVQLAHQERLDGFALFAQVRVWTASRRSRDLRPSSVGLESHTMAAGWPTRAVSCHAACAGGSSPLVDQGLGFARAGEDRATGV